MRWRFRPITTPFDYRFFGAVLALAVFGIVMLSSASAPGALAKFGDIYDVVKHQVFVGLIPGLLLMAGLSFVDYRIYKRWAFVLLIISLILLTIVFIPGIGAEFGTSRSWIYVFGYSFQPAELVKLTFLIYLATWLESRAASAKHASEHLLPFLGVLGAIVILMMLQPDLGTLVIIVAMSVIVYFVGGARLSHVAGIVAAGIAGILLLARISPYRAARLTVFLHPELDPQGIGYHINQAFLAIGSGGFFGRGFGLSRQKDQYLPEVSGDSVFAVTAEEFGFFFSSILVAGYLYFLYRALRIATHAPDRFGKLLVTGIAAWLGVQSFINIGAMVGLSPLTGVPLPFISQGGTALLVTLAACGIVLNVSRQMKSADHESGRFL